jgi:hypothetical protein
MSNWNAMLYEGKDTILRVVRNEAEQFFDRSGRHVLPAGRSRRPVDGTRVRPR